MEAKKVGVEAFEKQSPYGNFLSRFSSFVSAAYVSMQYKRESLGDQECGQVCDKCTVSNTKRKMARLENFISFFSFPSWFHECPKLDEFLSISSSCKHLIRKR